MAGELEMVGSSDDDWLQALRDAAGWPSDDVGDTRNSTDGASHEAAATADDASAGWSGVSEEPARAVDEPTSTADEPQSSQDEPSSISQSPARAADAASGTRDEPRHDGPVAEPTLPAPFGWTDGLTDTDGPRLWDRLLAMEQARNARHKRTSTVVLVDVVGMPGVVERWGTGLALQQFVQVAHDLAAVVRRSDVVARIGPSRFGVLLTETDEISAINFVGRLKGTCGKADDSDANRLSVVVGWASPEVGGRLADALTVAESRLADASRRS